MWNEAIKQSNTLEDSRKGHALRIMIHGDSQDTRSALRSGGNTNKQTNGYADFMDSWRWYTLINS